MKKTAVLLLCLALAVSCLALTACGGSSAPQDLSQSKYVGTWKAVDVSMGDKKETSEEVFSEGFTFELRGDGTATVTPADGDGACTWKETGSGIKTDGAMKLTLKDKDGGLDASILGVHVFFEKEP